ncbi:MAG TPA: translational machinery protein [Burkholderiaceae bacterium]
MNHNHAVIWIDHQKAHIMSFNKEDSDEQIVRAGPHAAHVHGKSGPPGSGHAQEDTAFFDHAVSTADGAKEILVVGPGVEKTLFAKYVAKSHPKFAEKIVGVETVDHPSSPQLLAYARKYFVKADLYH